MTTNDAPSIGAELIAGAAAGAAGIVSTQPLDTLRIRLQVTHGARGAVSCLQDMFKSEGIQGLYRGIYSPLLTVGAMNAVLFLSHSQAMAAMQRSSSEPDTALRHAQAGVLAGFTSAFITAPTELVKCRAQVQLTDLIVHSLSSCS